MILVCVVVVLFLPKKRPPFLLLPFPLPCIPTYISIIKSIFSFKEKLHDGAGGGEGKTLFYHTFLTCCQLDGKHGSLQRLFAVISDFKNEHGAIFKKTFSLSFASLGHHLQGVIY